MITQRKLGITAAILSAAFFASIGPRSFAQPAQQVGEQHEELVFSLRTGHGWDGPPRCEPHSGAASRTYTPPSGWVVISERYAQNTSNNGWTKFEATAGGPAYPSAFAVENQFGLLLALARATKNADAAREIDAIKSRWINARENATQNNLVVGTVWGGAHGNCGDRKDGWEDSTFFVTIRRVGDERELSDLVSSLKRKYFPDA